MNLNPYILITVMVGLIFIVAGFIQLSFPPKKINYLYGYRTKSSMKNQKRWDFAQLFSANELIRLGILLLLCSFLGFFIEIENSTGMILGLGIMILLTIILFIRTEKAIKNKFENK